MVYVNTKQSQINKYVGKKLSVSEIEETLKDMGMDMKGITFTTGKNETKSGVSRMDMKGVSDEKDPELKVEITAEKMDMVSAVGIARAIKYYKGLETKLPEYKIEKATQKVIVKKSAKKSRPKTVCVILKDIKMTQELLDEMIEIQEKIHASFGRNRKKASIGIYPCEEFDFPVTFTAEKPEDIKFIPLEMNSEMNAKQILKEHDKGKEYAHLLEGLEFYPVFRDKSEKVLSMPPIINSNDTGRVDLHHKNLFIEISGHNLTYLDNLLKIMVTTFIEMGASAQKVTVEYEGEDTYELNLENTEETLSLDYVNKLIGINLKSKDVEKLLNKVMYGLKKIEGDKITVLIPPFKSDVWHDSDIADDIARAYGYNNIVPKYPNISSVGETLEFSDFREQLTQSMVNFGFLELYTYILTSSKTQFEKMNLGKGDKEYTKLLDSEDQGINMTRVRVLPEILESLHINRKNKYPQKVFENGFTIQSDEKADTKAKNQLNLSVAIADPKSNYTQIKAVLDTLMKLNQIDFEIKEHEEIPFLIPGRSAEIFVNKKSVGFIGELHPQVLTNFGLLVPVSCFEIIVDDIFEK